MTDRELLQQALDMLDDINQCSLPPTGIPLPAEIDHVMEALRDRLAQPELPLVRVEEFVELIKGNEGVFGRPVMRTEWPTEEKPWVKTYSGGKPNYTQPIEREPILPGGGGGSGEPTIDGWPLYSGLPPIKVQDEREENYKSFAQSAQVLGITEPEPVAWMNPKEESDGYAFSFKQQGVFTVPLYTALSKKEWVGLTDEEIQAVHYELKVQMQGAIGTIGMYRMLEKALREKNGG